MKWKNIKGIAGFSTMTTTLDKKKWLFYMNEYIVVSSKNRKKNIGRCFLLQLSFFNDLTTDRRKGKGKKKLPN